MLAPTAPLTLIESIMNRADASFARQEFSTTIELLSLAVELEPESIPLLNALGSLQYRQAEYAAAAATFQQQARLDQNNSDLQVQLGMASLELNRFSVAELALQNALRMRPNDPLATKLLAGIPAARLNPRTIAAPKKPFVSKYNLDHLTQEESQAVAGPVQDDEALFLYSVIRGMRLKTVFEIGGLSGYSAINFLRAVGDDGTVYTCDINPVPIMGPNHRFIHKSAVEVEPADLEHPTLDLIFFDCHLYEIQMALFSRFKAWGIIDDHTVIALHDTNTHPSPAPSNYPTSQGYVHQPVERRMVNDFVQMGYHSFSLHTRLHRHSAKFPYRHGVTLMSRFVTLVT